MKFLVMHDQCEIVAVDAGLAGCCSENGKVGVAEISARHVKAKTEKGFAASIREWFQGKMHSTFK
jgi:hypothetical protein